MPIRFALRTMLVVGVVVAAFLVLVPWDTVTVWDGRFPLQVSLQGMTNRQIVEVAADRLGRAEYASYVRNDPSKLDLDLQPVEWMDGQPFTVNVPCSGRTTSAGREVGYAQYHLLVLRISFADGEVKFIPVEIPDGRETREVRVVLADYVGDE